MKELHSIWVIAEHVVSCIENSPAVISKSSRADMDAVNMQELHCSNPLQGSPFRNIHNFKAFPKCKCIGLSSTHLPTCLGVVHLKEDSGPNGEKLP